MPETALRGEEISNEADFLTDLVVGADRAGRSGEYAQAYAKSELKTRMDALADRNAKVWHCPISLFWCSCIENNTRACACAAGRG